MSRTALLTTASALVLALGVAAPAHAVDVTKSKSNGNDSASGASNDYGRTNVANNHGRINSDKDVDIKVRKEYQRNFDNTYRITDIDRSIKVDHNLVMLNTTKLSSTVSGVSVGNLNFAPRTYGGDAETKVIGGAKSANVGVAAARSDGGDGGNVRSYGGDGGDANGGPAKAYGGKGEGGDGGNARASGGNGGYAKGGKGVGVSAAVAKRHSTATSGKASGTGGPGGAAYGGAASSGGGGGGEGYGGKGKAVAGEAGTAYGGAASGTGGGGGAAKSTASNSQSSKSSNWQSGTSTNSQSVTNNASLSIATGSIGGSISSLRGINPVAFNTGIASSQVSSVNVNAMVGSVFGSGSIGAR